MIYKRLLFRIEKKKLPEARTGANIFDFSIINEDDKKPLFEVGILHFKEESAKRMAERAFIEALKNGTVKI